MPPSFVAKCTSSMWTCKDQNDKVEKKISQNINNVGPILLMNELSSEQRENHYADSCD